MSEIETVPEHDDDVWEPGDKCWMCGSTDTVFQFDGVILLGAHCNGCGASDNDE